MHDNKNKKPSLVTLRNISVCDLLITYLFIYNIYEL